MKILHCVETYSPLVNGMQTVVQQLSERMVEMGHEVTVVTTKLSRRTNYKINGVNIVEFDIKGNFVRGLEGEVDRYQKFLLNSDYDVITAFAAQQWATDIILPILNLIKAKKVFVPTGFSGLYEPSYAGYFEQMRNWMHNFDANIFLSNNYRDIIFARENRVKNIVVIPNGADEREFNTKNELNIKAKYNIPDKNRLILHVGGHTGSKGHKEAIAIFAKAKVKDATLFLISHPVNIGGCENACKNSVIEYNNSADARENNKQIVVDFPSRAETVAAYKSSDIFFFPSNIECSPLVIFEAMAAGVPFMGTDVGNVSEIIEWSNGGVLLPTTKTSSEMSVAKIEESAKLFEELLNNPEELSRLGQNGAEAWKKNFTWEKITKDYENLYSRLLSEKPTLVTPIKSFDIIFEPHNVSDIQMLQSYNSDPKIKKIIVVNNKHLDIPSHLISNKMLLESNANDKNPLLKHLSADYLLFLDSTNPIPNYYVHMMLEKAVLDDVGIVYPNYSSMKKNREERHRFSIFELDYDDRGQIFTTLLSKNKINTRLSNIMLTNAAINKVGGFKTELGQMQDWDLILRIAKEWKVDYIYQYNLLSTSENYYNNDLSVARFEDEIKFINLWSKNIDSAIAKKWGNYVSWKIKMVFPDSKLIKIAQKHLNNDVKAKLFRQSLGSIKLYLVLTFIIALLKSLIHKFMLSVNEVYMAIKNIILILLS